MGDGQEQDREQGGGGGAGENRGDPVRHPLGFGDPSFHDEDALDREMRRVFDICHGCRRCFSLCDSFPRLFDLVDEAGDEELDAVPSSAFPRVVEACTLCDMCFMVKCPYTPPHEFNIDFPHLMLRWRAVRFAKEGVSLTTRELARTDRNGRLGGLFPALSNMMTARGNVVARSLLERVTGVHREADLPRFHRPWMQEAEGDIQGPPARGSRQLERKVVLYATCHGNYHSPEVNVAARRVLAWQGVTVRPFYSGCCGMPRLEHGDVAAVAATAGRIAAELEPLVDDGFRVVTAMASCTLMLRLEWPLLCPGDARVRKLADATMDISGYLLDIARKEGLAEGAAPLDRDVMIHLACHARAQNAGPQGLSLLQLIPDIRVGVIERCSGHGGSWGVMKENFETAMEIGKIPVQTLARKAEKDGDFFLVSECPLAGAHLVQGTERLACRGKGKAVSRSWHPVELLAISYGLADGGARAGRDARTGEGQE